MNHFKLLIIQQEIQKIKLPRTFPGLGGVTRFFIIKCPTPWDWITEKHRECWDKLASLKISNQEKYQNVILFLGSTQIQDFFDFSWNMFVSKDLVSIKLINADP